ncbi:hypothetical protein CR513_29357, partial [Mucuna pruriens]
MLEMESCLFALDVEKPSKGRLSPLGESRSKRSHPGQTDSPSDRPTLQPSSLKEQSSPSVVTQSDQLNQPKHTHYNLIHLNCHITFGGSL